MPSDEKQRRCREYLGEKWPNEPHPLTGEPFETCLSLEAETEIFEHRYLPPQPPSRELWDYPDEDADEPVYVRQRTEEEYAEAMKAYRKACREWERTGGVAKVPGATTVKGHFVTESGAWAKGVLAPVVGGGSYWYWSEWGQDAFGRPPVSRETWGR